MFAPIAFNRSTHSVFDLVKMVVILVLGVWGFTFWSVRCLEERSWPPRSIFLRAVAAFLVAAGLSTFFSQHLFVSLVGLYQRYGGLLSLVLYASIGLVIFGLYWKEPPRLDHVAAAATTAGGIAAGYVLIQGLGLDWNRWAGSGAGSTYPMGPLGNSNFAGGYLAISAPYAVFVALAAKDGWYKPLLFVLAALMPVAVLLTASRGGMLALVMGLLTMGLFYLPALPARVKRAGGAATLVSAVVLVFLALGSASRPEALFARHFFSTGTLVDRSRYWASAWSIFLDHPVSGTGLETFYSNYPRYRSFADAAKLGLDMPDKPHNIFLEYAANSGALGIGSFLFIVGSALALGWRSSRSSTGRDRLRLVAFLSALVAYLTQGFFSIDVVPLAFTGWVTLGAIAAMSDPGAIRARSALARGGGPAASSGPAGPGPQSSRSVIVLQVSIGIAAVLVSILAVRLLVADVHAGAKSFADATRVHPREAEYHFELAEFLEDAALAAADAEQRDRLLSRAASEYLRALSLRPRMVTYVVRLAQLETNRANNFDSSRFRLADRWWSQAVALDSKDWEIRRLYSDMLTSWSGSEGLDRPKLLRSSIQLQQALRVKPKDSSLQVRLARTQALLGDERSAHRSLKRTLNREVSPDEASQMLRSIPLP